MLNYSRNGIERAVAALEATIREEPSEQFKPSPAARERIKMVCEGSKRSQESKVVFRSAWVGAAGRLQRR